MNQEVSGSAHENAFDVDSGGDPGSDMALGYLGDRADVAQAYLRRRMELLDLQIRHVKHDAGLHRIGAYLKLGIQALIALTGLIVVVAVATLIWMAVHSRSVVIDDFDSPPELAQKGLNGRVMASGVLDELTKLQAATRSSADKPTLKSAWTGDIKIAIPDTGVSLGEMERLLRNWFGKDLHIAGSLVILPDGRLALTVRGDGVLPRTFIGNATALPALTGEAAEYIYGEAQPYLYATWLVNAGRYEDAVRFASFAYPHASDQERPQLANSWGNALGSLGRIHEAAATYRLAVAGDQRFWKAWGNLVGAVAYIDGEEASWRTGGRMRELARQSPADNRPRPIDYLNIFPLEQDWTALLGSFVQDLKAHNGVGSQADIAAPFMADYAARLHDWQGAAQYLAASDPDDAITKAQTALNQGYRAIDRGDYAGAVAPLASFYNTWLTNMNIRFNYSDQGCALGLAYGMTGRMQEADLVFRRVGRWARCTAYRARALEHAGDWRGAVAQYRAAIALTPDLPLAYDHWGQALLRRGDLDGAAAAFREAAKRGPHWADPLKHWGDVLIRQGKAAEARRKYDDALRYAPHWEELERARAG
jgi:tetratricopeptide (TPR) repeat protein